ncbi:hypothetical protein [Chroococcus sp. FPU101]|uniref:nucleotide-binding protein n=1 Tax=Chroococcus sp. FPU101 TaxID=1974212 RepID=UPI001A8DE2B4|nr:hypothetical protein [Chroococcus sp. FPU101]GFE69041.1 hypothetical protein CFPU101_16510 [Chroococcus sp. FPU101]
MGVVHLVGGQKGGSGKTFFARILCHYFHAHKLAVQILDADPQQDLHRVYGGIGGIQFWGGDADAAAYSKSSNEMDILYDLAVEHPLVLVNLPGNAQEGLAWWLTANRLLESELQDIEFRYWYLCNSLQGLEAFNQSLAFFAGKLAHCLVLNQFGAPDWDYAQFSQIKYISLPVLHRTEAQLFNDPSHPLTYGDALKVGMLPRLAQKRLFDFLSIVFADLEVTGWLDKPNLPVPVSTSRVKKRNSNSQTAEVDLVEEVGNGCRNQT